MDVIKPLGDLPLLTQQEPVSSPEQIQSETGVVSQSIDTIEAVDASTNPFDTNLVQTPFASERASETSALSTQISAQLQVLQQQLTDLKNQKQGIIEQISQLEAEYVGLELSQQQSANPQTANKMSNLQSQIAGLQSQLATVDVEIKEVLNEITKLQDEENSTTISTESQIEIGKGAAADLNKAEDSYQQILSSVSILLK